MKPIKGSDILALGGSLAALRAVVDALDPERMNRAVQAACGAADMHLKCSYPECTCKQMPTAVRAAIESWESRKR